jgi:signal transduction histidine kinase
MTHSPAIASAGRGPAFRARLIRLLKRHESVLTEGRSPGTNGSQLALDRQVSIFSSGQLPTRLALAAHQNPIRLTRLSAWGVVLVGVLDYLTGPELLLAVLYLLPVILTTWFAGKRNGILVAALAGLVWTTADLASSPPPLHLGVALWSLSSRLGVLALVMLLLARIRVLQSGLEETIARRTRQLETEIVRGRALEREITAVSTREQQHIAHDLHDSLGSELGGLAMHAKILAAKLAAGGVPHSADAERLVSLLNQSISRTRALSNLLDPVRAESGGLLHALEKLAERSTQLFGITCTIRAPATLPALSPAAELDLYRIAQEAIHNAAQHGAASDVRVEVALESQALKLTVTDNGRGFIPQPADSGQDCGLGLRIMGYRASALGARLEIDSEPGHGSTVRCMLSLP